MPTESARSDESVEYGPIRRQEIATAARIYVASFPDRVALLFSDPDPALAFYTDLLELVRRAYGSTFFAARVDGRLAGFLALTEGTHRLLGASLRGGYLVRTAARALTGAYGSAPALVRRVAASVAGGRKERARGFDRLPQVYVVAIDPAMTGRGIGTRLLSLARTACEPRVDRIWLRVESRNTGAIRLYQKVGFHVVESDATEHIMVWPFDRQAS